MIATTTSAGSTPVHEALVQHYRLHALPADGGESSPWFRVVIGPLSIPLPNPPSRRRAVFFHDVNHVLTGYNTTFSDGEMSIAAFEVASGCGPYWIAWYINLSLLAIGLVIRPRLAFKALVRGRRSGSIYERPEDRTVLSAMWVAELRSLVGIADDSLPPTAADRAIFAVWGAVGVATLLAPLLVPGVAIWVAIRLLGG